jgi:hypothetical protein
MLAPRAPTIDTAASLKPRRHPGRSRTRRRTASRAHFRCAPCSRNGHVGRRLARTAPLGRPRRERRPPRSAEQRPRLRLQEERQERPPSRPAQRRVAQPHPRPSPLRLSRLRRVAPRPTTMTVRLGRPQQAFRPNRTARTIGQHLRRGLPRRDKDLLAVVWPAAPRTRWLAARRLSSPPRPACRHGPPRPAPRCRPLRTRT